jgi:hypothetical protein
MTQKDILFETSLKYESNGTLLVTYNSYFGGQIISQSSTSKCVVTLYVETERE